MIKRTAVKSIMFISSYFPLYIMLLILHYEKYDTLEEIKRIKAIVFCLTMIIGIVISVISVILIKLSYGSKVLNVSELERPDDTVISYMMTYIIPIVSTNFLDKGQILVNVILFLLIGYLYIRLNLLYLNPLWSIFGYLSYRVNSDVIVITNIKYKDLKTMSRNEIGLKGVFLADDIFLALKKYN